MDNTKQRSWQINGLGMGILIYFATSGIAEIIRAVKGTPKAT